MHLLSVSLGRKSPILKVLGTSSGVPLKDPLGGPWGFVSGRLTPNYVLIILLKIYLDFNLHTTLQKSTTRPLNTLVHLASSTYQFTDVMVVSLDFTSKIVKLTYTSIFHHLKKFPTIN